MSSGIGIILAGMVLFAVVGLGALASKSSATPGTPTTPTTPTNGQTPSAAGVGAGAAAIMQFLEGSGFTRTAAAGIVGNLQQESSLNPAEPGGGLAQWIGSRWTSLESYAAGQGLSPSSQQAQLQFMVQEISSSYPTLTAQLNAAGTPGEAATIFSNVYERPGTPMLANRIAYANAAYQQG